MNQELFDMLLLRLLKIPHYFIHLCYYF